jgi:peptidoglycan hydrolase CwlO-like protein
MRLPSNRRLVAALVVAGCALPIAVAGADVQGKIGASRAKDHALQGSIGADSKKINEFQGRIDDLRRTLAGLTQSLQIQEAQLSSLQGRLRSARSRLADLKRRSVHDQQVLADQLVGQYEAPHPDFVTVVLNARGFAQLLELANGLKRVSDQNARVVAQVRRSRVAVAHQTTSLVSLEAQQQRVTAAALVQRDEVDQLKQQLIGKQVTVYRSRAAKRAHLARLRSHRAALEKRLAAIQSAFSGAGPGLPSGGAPGFANHGGAFGFFQAPGTNYSYGDEPRIAARLDVMGKALHLHLLGLSGYRTPQHSVEVGGFANDPHTRGQASDTPGLEGVPEATLNHYGLTRPFAGAAEADHVQLVGSI